MDLFYKELVTFKRVADNNTVHCLVGMLHLSVFCRSLKRLGLYLVFRALRAHKGQLQ